MTARSFLVPANPARRVGCVTPQMFTEVYLSPWDPEPSGPFIAGGGLVAARARRMQVEARRVRRRADRPLTEVVIDEW